MHLRIENASIMPSGGFLVESLLKRPETATQFTPFLVLPRQISSQPISRKFRQLSSVKKADTYNPPMFRGCRVEHVSDVLTAVVVSGRDYPERQLSANCGPNSRAASRSTR
jgi:hypothetical protein